MAILSQPHSGYHWRSQADRFFEGWYVRLTLPDIAQTFAFMYSIDDPAGGGDYSGGAAQILGPDETYYCRTFPSVNAFWAWSHQLGFGHRRGGKPGQLAQYLQPSTFFQSVQEGYQVGNNRHQGKLLSPSAQVVAKWDYHIEPIAGWGGKTEKATAGWLSYLPVFEPGWQVLMAHGLASGSVHWQGIDYTFEQVPAYAEKNWGGAFPSKWFWVQCNAFANAPGLSITAAGGVRDVLGWKENVGLVGIHCKGAFYEFFTPETTFAWTVDPWGYWHWQASSDRYRVELIGRSPDGGTRVRVPTREGLQWLCRDTTHGELHLKLSAMSNEQTIVEATSQLAGLEVGGGPWDEPWIIRS